uniref:Uncharacterized protein n=1 Tax=Babesia bovis TaxID=5865 RepID=S6BP18_BABBO|nr:hypothetical protein [Babesia bovis]
MRSIAHRSGSGIDFSELKSPSLVPPVGKVPISSARYTSVFSDLESTEGVIKLFQGLAKCRWRLIREFSASWNCDDDVSFSCPRSSHPPLTNAIPRNGGVKGGFINKLAQFLTSTRRARETTIDMDLYHDAYSSSREHFDPRSIEEVLLRGWCAFLVGKPSPSVPSPTAATQIPKSTPLPVTKGGTSPGKGEDWISCFDILGQHDLLAGKFMSHVSDDDLEAFAFAPGGHRRKGSEKRPRNSRGESPVGVRSANVDQRRVGVEPSRKPRRPSKTLIGRITDTEYCEFKDKQVRYKFVSVVKWDEDVESLSAITDKVLA